MKEIPIYVFDANSRVFSAKCLCLRDGIVTGFSETDKGPGKLYISPGFIDAHAHVYPGATCTGIDPERIGLKTGVHLIIDAGSAGSAVFDCFRDYVIPAFETEIKAYLNIGRTGMVTKHPYTDRRNIDIEAAVKCMNENDRGLLLGIKVMASGIIAEESGILPLRKAIEAADLLQCRVMAHLSEGPPANEDTMPLLRSGDIITHCFHGRPNVQASLTASGGARINPAFYSIPNVMWNGDGTPTKPLENALSRGVQLDVGHGAASFDRDVASRVIRTGFRNFSISTDAHIRNIDGVVRGLAETMSKFLALGMTIDEVTASVTVIPALQHGLSSWCDDLSERATIFRLRSFRPDDLPLVDSGNMRIEAGELVEPIAVVVNGRMRPIGPVP